MVAVRSGQPSARLAAGTSFVKTHRSSPAVPLRKTTNGLWGFPSNLSWSPNRFARNDTVSGASNRSASARACSNHLGNLAGPAEWPQLCSRFEARTSTLNCPMLFIVGVENRGHPRRRKPLQFDRRQPAIAQAYDVETAEGCLAAAEDRLVADMIELARQYGRYGYRRIAAPAGKSTTSGSSACGGARS